MTKDSPGIAVNHESTLHFLRKIISNPLQTIPPEAFHEPLVYSDIGGKPRIYLSDPAIIQDVFINKADFIVKGTMVQRILGPALGNGLLTTDEGSNWRRQRQSIGPEFQHARLLDFQAEMIKAAERTRDRWSALGSQAQIDLRHEMMLTTFDVIGETMLSGRQEMDVFAIEQDIATYLKAAGWLMALEIMHAPAWTPFPGRRRSMAAARSMRQAVVAMVARRRKENSRRDDLVSRLLATQDLESGKSMSDEEITDNLLTFIAAGHETTAQGLSWTFYLLSQHPEIETKVIKEIENVTKGQALRPDHIAQLVYTRQVFSEAIRLYPPVPLFTRKVVKNFTLGDFTIPADAILITPIFAVHRHTSLWDQPDQFIPERFDPEQVKARHRFSFLPFGAGPRTCIGNAFAMMEAVAILAVLLPVFHLVYRSRQAPVPTLQVTLQPKHKLYIQVHGR
ncbi:cytochrome P450 [Beijerinckia indica]|nr:cytochrome P450 [Beijerinckia indica]